MTHGRELKVDGRSDEYGCADGTVAVIAVVFLVEQVVGLAVEGEVERYEVARNLIGE